MIKQGEQGAGSPDRFVINDIDVCRMDGSFIVPESIEDTVSFSFTANGYGNGACRLEDDELEESEKIEICDPTYGSLCVQRPA